MEWDIFCKQYETFYYIAGKSWISYLLPDDFATQVSKRNNPNAWSLIWFRDMRESRLGPSRDQEKDSFVLLVISYQVK